jgi:acyl carrier protein
MGSEELSEGAMVMNEEVIARLVDKLLLARGLRFTAQSRLVRDLNLDSIDVLTFIIDLEAQLECTLDTPTQLALIDACVGDIPAILASRSA